MRCINAAQHIAFVFESEHDKVAHRFETSQGKSALRGDVCHRALRFVCSTHQKRNPNSVENVSPAVGISLGILFYFIYQIKIRYIILNKLFSLAPRAGDVISTRLTC